MLGTYVEIHLQGDVGDIELINQSNDSFAQIEAIHRAMSFHEVGSELSKVNQLALQAKSATLNSSMLTVFLFINELNAISRGLFDPTIAPELIKDKQLPFINGQDKIHSYGNWSDIEIDDNQIHFNNPVLIDLGGIAKGFAVDQAIECADKNISMVVNAGGDIRMSDWQQQNVSIRTPSNPQQHELETPMLDSAVATSANYFNNGQSAIVNPKDLKLTNNKHSISVFANNCLTADALTKVIWLTADFRHILSHYNAQALVINANGAVLK